MRRPQLAISIKLFLTCWLIYALHFATNTVREIYPALSLGDRLSFDVSEYLGFHSDIFEIPGRGAYINNNPGASILGALPYALARPVIDRVSEIVKDQRLASGAPIPEYQSIYIGAREFYRKAYARGLDVKFGLSAGVMQAFLMAPLAALSVSVMFIVLFSLTRRLAASTLLALLYGIATPVFFRAAQLNQNLLQAIFAWLAFVLLWRPWDDSQAPRRPAYLLAGLLTGWTLVLDYSGLVIILALGFYAVFRRRLLPATSRKVYDLILFGVGVAACIAILMGYQWLAFGNPFYPAQHYMPASFYSGAGYQGMDWPKIDLLLQNSFGVRYGLFLSAPISLLALYFPGWLPRRARLIGDLQTAFVVGFTLAFLLFTAANQYSRMQFNTGVRHMLPVVPFLFLLVATVILKMRPWLAVLVGLLSAYWSWCLAMYRDVEQGYGILESLIHISTEGPRLPWLSTLQGIGIAPAWLSPSLVLMLAVLAIVAIWTFPFSRLGRNRPFGSVTT